VFLAVRWLRKPDDPMKGLPPVMLWAWDRPEDLRFLDCKKAGVAFLAKTVTLSGGQMTVRPRMQPLLMPKGCQAMATTRVEAGEGKIAVSAADVAAEIAKLGYGSRVAAVQVDFDATASQRDFYRELLEDVRERLPGDVLLSMTALASWCMHDGWIEELPVDEAVPMLFRMGVDDGAVRRHLDQGKGFRVDLCKTSVGLATDEPGPSVSRGVRWYVFHPRSWDRAAVNDFFE
jgi:hypothetical protein